MGHIHGANQHDFTASAYIIYEEKVLLLLHKKLQIWLPPGGHIELDESPLEALYRETFEETGLAKENLTLTTPHTENLSFARDAGTNRTEPLPFDIDIHPVGDNGHKHIDFAYIFTSNTNQIRQEEEGADEIAWFTLAEAEQLQSLPLSSLSRAKYALQQSKIR